MKLDLMKIVQGILTAVHVVEKIKNAKGSEKLQAVIDSTPEMIQVIEANLSKDVLNDAQVVTAETNLINAYIAFQRTVDAVKLAKGTGLPV